MQWPKFLKAPDMTELDHAGFMFSTTMTALATLDSKIAEGFMKMVPTEFKRKLQVLEQNQQRKMLPMLTGRQIEYHMFSFFKINCTQGQ